MLHFSESTPDFSFTILSNTPNVNVVGQVQYSPNSIPKLKSIGSINNIFEMNMLMSDSLDIIAPLNISGFKGNVSDTSDVWSTYHPSGIWFSPNFPNFLLPLQNPSYKSSPHVIPNVITWEVIRQEPGTVESKPFRGTQEITPRRRECLAYFSNDESKYIIGDKESSIEDYSNNLKYIEVNGQFFDNLIQYNIWSKSNYEVEMLTEWFQQYMILYTGMFREAGVNNLWFDRRIRDDTKEAMNNGYHVRSVLYYVRTERISINSINPITRINLNVKVDTVVSTINQINRHQIDSNLNKYLVDKWIKRVGHK